MTNGLSMLKPPNVTASEVLRQVLRQVLRRLRLCQHVSRFSA
jgi:hypothetical protein